MRMMSGLRVVVAFLVLFCCFAVSPCFSKTPLETMEETVGEVFLVLRSGDTADGKIWKEQRAKVSVIVSSRFDMREIAKRSLAKHWRKLTPSQQDEFAHLFSNLVKNTYIDRLRSFSGSNSGVRFDKEIVKGKKGAVSSLVLQNGHEVSVVYKLYSKKGVWLVYDVIIENVSLVRNYRSQFSQVMKKGGYSLLVQKVQDKLLAARKAVSQATDAK